MAMYRILIYIFIPKLILAQINGEFWWLNSELQKFKKTDLPSPKFEALSEFDNDETAKIIFREEFIPYDKVPNINSESKENNKDTNSKDNDLKTESITWSNNLNSNVDITKLVPDNELMELENTSTKQGQQPTNEDLFVFKFPDDKSEFMTQKPKGILENKESGAMEAVAVVKTKFNITNRKTHKDMILFKFPENVNYKHTRESYPEHEKFRNENSVLSGIQKNESENICSYMKKKHCFENSGIVYEHKKPKTNHSNHLICCVLPLPVEREGRIIFPDSNERLTRRIKRSSGAKMSLNQRDFILKQRFREPSNPTASNTKLVTPDDEYVDPYWNIKNNNFKTPTAQSIKKQECNHQDYADDYVVELPRPGLIGLYSDQGANTPGGWTYQNDYEKPTYDSVEDEDDATSVFGYSTVDPRRVSTSNTPKRGRPIKLTTTEPEVEIAYDVESQTVNFQSNPNFQVLQGFKLLNFGRDKNKLFTKIPRGTTATSIEDESQEAVTIKLDGNQVYDNCGKFEPIINERNSKQIGEAEAGSHPWLAVVVNTRRPQNILCYATIVHPRAAITAGDCVSSYTKSSSSKEVILVAGLRDSRDRTQTQNRFVTIQLHPQYRRETLNYNLALLHWQRSLRLNTHVQPACLTHPNVDCKFFGWGGFDQAMRQRPRWQRASILSVQDCEKRFAKGIKLPKDAFCATVQARGTVTGIGGSLICTSNGRASTAGVAVHRDTVLVLIPAQEWILLAMEDLNIE